MHDSWPDDALYRGLMSQNPRALEALIQRYSREMTYFIRLVLDGIGTAQDAEECVNDLFVAIWQEIESFDAARGALRTWMTMRGKFIALDRRRQLQRVHTAVTSLDGGLADGRSTGDSRAAEMPLALADERSLEGQLEQRERREELRLALISLSELDRTLVYLRYFHLADTEEICRRTKLTRHAVDTRLWRARKQLRDVLDALEEQAHGRNRAHKEAQRRR